MSDTAILDPSIDATQGRLPGKEPQHTPGPWNVGGSEEHWDADPERSRPCYTTQPISAAGRPDPICLVIEDESNGLGTGNPRLSANARLIASAPDLLKQRDALRLAMAELLAAGADDALEPDDGLALDAPYRAALDRHIAACTNARAVLEATGG